MHVGLNLLYLIPGEVGGTETYGVSLVDALARQFLSVHFTAFVNEESNTLPLPSLENLHIVQCQVKARSRPRRYWFEQLRLPGLVRRHRIDVLHSLGYTSCLFCPCLSVVTIHDLHIRNGEFYSWTKRVARRLFESCSAKRADAIIAPSQFSKQEIAVGFHVLEKSVFVVHEASKIVRRAANEEEAEAILRGCGVQRPYIVAFSSTYVHKNIHRLIQAFERIADFCSHQLVLIGHTSVATQKTLKSLPHAIQAKIKALGYVPDGWVHAVLKHADLVVFPSWYEGFGLPALEAQMCGVPLACSTAACLPEIAGEGALYFNPYSVEDIARAMLDCLHDDSLAGELRRRGFLNAQQFSWANAARETMDVYLHVLGKRRYNVPAAIGS